MLLLRKNWLRKMFFIGVFIVSLFTIPMLNMSGILDGTMYGHYFMMDYRSGGLNYLVL